MGYAIVFIRKPGITGAVSKAAITDIFCDPSCGNEPIDNLIEAAISLAVESKAGSLVIDVMNDIVEHSLKKHGFWKVGSGLHLIADLPGTGLELNRKDWYITRADSDISIFEGPNI